MSNPESAITQRESRLLGLPTEAWSRILVLFAALVIIKLALVVELRKHLHEIHWRVDVPPITWVNYASFYGLLLLGTLSLFELSRHCRSVGPKAVRSANAVVLVLGFLFIFLTFHIGNKNYLYIVTSGVLTLKDLLPYLSLNFFFQSPYLAAWLVGYALVYYFLVRTGREGLALYLTAIFAVLYLALCFQELVRFRSRLLPAEGFGIASLLIARRTGKPPRLSWLLLPIVWTLLVWELFRLETPALDQLTPYFLMLLTGTSALFYLATLLAKKFGFYQIWARLLPFYFTTFLLVTASRYPMSPNYGRLLCLGIEFPRYFLGEMLVAGCLVLVTWLCTRRRSKPNLWWLDALNITLIALALVDLRLTQTMGVRLGWDVLSFGNSIRMMWRMARPFLPGLLLAVTVTGLGYFLFLWASQQWLRRRVPALLTRHVESDVGGAGFGSDRPCRSNNSLGAWYLVFSSLFLGLAGLIGTKPDKAEGQAALRLVETSPLWKLAADRPLSKQEFLGTVKALGLNNFELTPTTGTRQPQRNLNVLLVFMESTYNRHLSLFGADEDTQPLLSKYKDRMELFPNFFSSFAGSIHARFATFTSLYPIQDFNAFTLKRVPVKSLFELMHDAGYSSSLFYSSFLDYTGFRDFLNQRGLDAIYDADTMPGTHAHHVAWGLSEDETLNAMRRQIQQYASRHQRFFLTYVPAAPHYPYDNIPQAFRKYARKEMDDYTPQYLNELLYIDWVLASLLDQLKESEVLDQTLVIITNDHGEMLGAKGGPIGHGWAITPELANTPLIIMDPERTGYRLNYTFGSQIDLLPTILERLNILPPTDQLYQGRSLDASNRESSVCSYLNSYQQYGVLWDKQIALGDQHSDSPETVYSISNEGAKTLFSEIRDAHPPAISIRRFDHFQENFLHNYSFYCQMIRGGAQSASSARK